MESTVNVINWLLEENDTASYIGEENGYHLYSITWTELDDTPIERTLRTTDNINFESYSQGWRNYGSMV